MRARHALNECESMRMPLLTSVDLERVRLVAEATLGNATALGAEFDALLSRVSPHLGGVPLGRLHEARAQVALLARDFDAFDRHAQRVDEIYRPGKHPALVARIDRLYAQRRAIDGAPLHKARAVTAKISGHDHGKIAERVHAAMADCADYPAVATNTLALLMDQSDASAGYLLTFHARAVDVSARIDAAPAPDELLAYAGALANGDLSETTMVSTGRQATHHPSDRRFVSQLGRESFLPLVFECRGAPGGTFTVVSMLRVDSTSRPRIPVRLTEVLAEYLAKAYARPQTKDTRSA
jgi:hypothetical protein